VLVSGAGRGSRRVSLVRSRPGRRTVALLVAYLLAFGLIGHRLVTVQVLEAEDYASLGERQRLRTIELPATRGRIFDRNGDLLATSIDAATIYADPRAYRPQTLDDGTQLPPAADAADVAAALAPVIDRPADELEERLRRDAHFVYLRRQAPWAVGQEVRELDLPGIGLLTAPDRVYPGANLASQVLGFVDIDGEGLSGLEIQHDSILRGEPGLLALERAPGGLDIAAARRHVVPPVDGTDLVLTIDREIQHVTERAAEAAVEELGAVGAGVVVLDASSGEVLAMVSVPGYDSNDPTAVEPEMRRNRAVTDMFEPGSIQKAVTVAAALEEGLVEPDTVLDVPRTVTVAGKTFTDVGNREAGPLTVREIVGRSSNVGTILMAQELGTERLASYLDAFGYGQLPGLGFPGESGGASLPLDQWSATSLPTIAIGHGVATTLLQAATVYGTIANDGVANQPRIVRGTVGGDGHLEPAAPGRTHRVISEGSARALRAMLIDAVHGEGGTGLRAAVPGYRVAGKTGTARKPLEGARGYSSEYIASFVGFAPAEEPSIVVAVMVDEPTPYYGGLAAAPLFSEVATFALAHRRVPPTHPDERPAVTAP
jgi:cell division protein FtsI (penicillin-binding protein 3)